MLYVVGLGPGEKGKMSLEAMEVIRKVEVIVGYTTYVRLIHELVSGKEIISTGMKQEIDRCKKAIEVAKEGKNVAVISSGDAGVYGMAGLVLELLSQTNDEINVKIVPGITASIAGAALLGAPLMNDFCHISLSDLMTPWEMIEKRLHAAASADFVICLYNHRSKGRPNHLTKALEIIQQYKPKETILGLAKDIGRKKEKAILTTMAQLDETMVDMTTVVLVGNKETYIHNERMITPRGYQL
ncbi:precorrin-3B C(17)-methyltransferase [Enterococcus raffinosus]|uniref:precorrin-3B C(17)-methyltransferase n=1 Tax=Enterococcus raffinosus TaxID=71452 RepID=UPI002892149B|nr:precorrin-3B C(17)-methyltransferase [Enterococcus raffinosus]MDT2528835.1 precorrin-3B C(17)-methyltransferase [Enterococcus raffinosus]